MFQIMRGIASAPVLMESVKSDKMQKGKSGFSTVLNFMPCYFVIFCCSAKMSKFWFSRAALGWSIDTLNAKSGVSSITLRRIKPEGGLEKDTAANLKCIKQTLEQAGIEFIGSVGEGLDVRHCKQTQRSLLRAHIRNLILDIRAAPKGGMWRNKIGGVSRFTTCIELVDKSRNETFLPYCPDWSL